MGRFTRGVTGIAVCVLLTAGFAPSTATADDRPDPVSAAATATPPAQEHLTASEPPSAATPSPSADPSTATTPVPAAEPAAPTPSSPSATSEPTTSAQPSAAAPSGSATPDPTPAGEPSPAPAAVNAAAITPQGFNGELYEITAPDSACGGAAADPAVSFDFATRAMVVDLDVVNGATELSIARSATNACAADVTSLSFTGSAPSLRQLTIGEQAFAQVTPGEVHLASVTFPEGITNLWIHSEAFRQFSGAGPSALTHVSFPSTLTALSIEASAFAQITTGPETDNALTSVSFPDSITNLTLGGGAFAQWAIRDNTLASVSFPKALTGYQRIDDEAFYQQADGHNALASVEFPDGISSLSLGVRAFGQRAVFGNALASVSFPATANQLDLGAQSFLQASPLGHNALRTLTIPDATQTLNIDTQAFSQEVDGADTNTSLTQVLFPPSMSILKIGTSSFAQVSQHGDSTLGSLRFPATTSSKLFVDEDAFAQGAPNGRTALTTVLLPSTVPMLYLASGAFRQEGATNSLRTVTFPATVDGILVEEDAFAQRGTPTLATILFPFSAPPAMGTLIDDQAVPPSASVQWLWFGPDAVKLSDWKVLDARSGENTGTIKITNMVTNPDQPLVGYRTLTLTGLNGADETSYVYRDGQTLAGPLSGKSASVGTPTPGGGWATTLPAASWNGRTLLGWCSSTVAVDARCSGTLADARSTMSLKANTVLWANWLTTQAVITPPSLPRSPNLPTGETGHYYRQVITVTGSGTISCALTAGSLPPGLSLDGCTVSGVPNAAGSYRFTITASNAAGSDAQAFSLTIGKPDSPNSGGGNTNTNDTLAYTGTDTLVPFTAFAVMLIAAGAALAVRRRRDH